MCRIIDLIFDDKRIAITIVMCWMSFMLCLLHEIGLLDSKFMKIGPSDETVFMGMKLNTWYKYNLVMFMSFMNTCFNDFMSDSISPWILNTITDHKTKYIPYSKRTCILITQSWSIYCNIMSIFSIFLALTQVDFVIIRALADVCMTAYTNMRFMRNKIHDRAQYEKAQNHHVDEGVQLETFTIEEQTNEEGGLLQTKQTMR